MDPASLALLLSPPALALLGLCIGSFLNVVIHRLPQMLERQWRADSADLLGLPASADAPDQPPLGLWRPRSRCPACGHVLAWHENMPLLGWLRLRGRCSACRTPISLRYPLVEAATALLFAALGAVLGPQPAVLLWCGLVATLLAAALIDWDTTLLPDQLTQPLLWSGLIVAALGWGRVPLTEALWGAVAGYGSLWAVTAFFKLATGKIGMGQGDFKLLAALGAWLGPTMLLPIVLAASMIGAVVGIGMKLSGALREGRYVPFGPFLAGAGLAVLFAGADRVTGWLGWY
jgi:leader peptidase (prepilin peptidase)/N-methyltransferase